MKLIKISKRKKGLSELLFDCEISPSDFEAEVGPTGLLAVDSELLFEKGVSESDEFSEEELTELVFASNLRRAKQRALYYLSRQDHTEKELFLKLEKSFGKKASKLAVERMVELNYVNDLSFANRYLESLVIYQNKSLRETEAKLRQKGIDSETLSIAKDEFFEKFDYSSVDTIKEIINKKYLTELKSGDRKQKEKIFAALLRKGFSSGDIASAMNLDNYEWD